jgi:catechol 2,3-dioxygenase-like lactoylglutathione lyase family enzyme
VVTLHFGENNMKITGADHTSFTVSNLDRSLAFYRDMLGFEVIWIRPQITNQYWRDIVGFPDAVVRGAFLAIPGTTHRLELYEYMHPRGTPADVRTNNPGSVHLCLYVDDARALYAELIAKGVQFRSAPVDLNEGPNIGGVAMYMLDPDGITLELFQAPRKNA